MALLSLVAVLLGTLLPGAALAQAPPDQLKEAVVGPYKITVISRPPEPVEGLGGPRFTVAVVTAGDGTPVTDADVTIALAKPGGKSAGEVKLSSNPSMRNLYEGRLTLKDPGVWSWQVAVTNPLGMEIVEGAITVREAPSSGAAGMVAWVLTFVALGVLLGLAYLNLRPRRKAQG